MVAVSCVLFAAGGLGLGRVLFDEDPWAPLGPYPIQQVDAPRGGDDLPTVSLSEDGEVPVSGRKCVREDGMTITGWVAWQSVEPRGNSVRTGTGTREAAAGCQSFEFTNVIPPDVERIMAHQIADGLRPVWRIVGTETPSSSERGEGVPLAWSTEPFRVVP